MIRATNGSNNRFAPFLPTRMTGWVINVQYPGVAPYKYFNNKMNALNWRIQNNPADVTRGQIKSEIACWGQPENFTQLDVDPRVVLSYPNSYQVTASLWSNYDEGPNGDQSWATQYFNSSAALRATSFTHLDSQRRYDPGIGQFAQGTKMEYWSTFNDRFPSGWFKAPGTVVPFIAPEYIDQIWRRRGKTIIVNTNNQNWINQPRYLDDYEIEDVNASERLVLANSLPTEEYFPQVWMKAERVDLSLIHI